MYTLKELVERQDTTVEINGQWVPVRPIDSFGFFDTLKKRVSDAWFVLIGKADAFTWPGGQ